MRRLNHLFRRRVPPKSWITRGLVEEMCGLAAEVGRMVGIVLDRRGRVREVAVGDPVTVHLPPLLDPPGTRARLNGLRFLWTGRDERRLGTHDLALLRRHRLDALGLITFSPASARRRLERAYLLPPNPEDRPWAVLDPEVPERVPEDFLDHIKALEEEFRGRAPGGYDTDPGERVLLVGTPREGKARHLEGDMAELESLVRSGGGKVVGEVVQRRAGRASRTGIRAGKVDEINIRALQTGADLILFLEDLTPSQANNLVQATGLKIIDRTQLILDIFAQRASTAEGKIMVELARLRYLLPRLVGKGQSLSRLGGGIGSNRGMGEKRLELDRRRIQETIERLTGRLESLRLGRGLRRRKRRRSRIPVLALVGYTNAGKTTLLNRLTGAGALAEDRLFSTLETTARRTRLPSMRFVVVTDTVGFIRDLPGDLKATFHATLEELGDATLLLHVADASHPDVFARVEAVEAILKELGVEALPRLLIYNKADRIDRDGFRPLLASHPRAVLLSARNRADLAGLRRVLDDVLDEIPGVPPRPVPRSLETPEVEHTEAGAGAREETKYTDILEEIPPAVPRPGNDSDRREWGFFQGD